VHQHVSVDLVGRVEIEIVHEDRRLEVGL
jgi:hypothetical protein